MTSFGRIISVRGSLARVGLLATSQTPVSEVRATVGTGGADLVGGPIGAHPGVVAALADRYRAALALNSSTTAR